MIVIRSAFTEDFTQDVEDLPVQARDVCISAITLAEPEYGACHSSGPEQRKTPPCAGMGAFLSIQMGTVRRTGCIVKE